MKEDLSDLVALRSIEDNGVFHIDMQQTYQGLRVYGGEYSVAVGADKAIQMLGGKYYAQVQAPTSPAISLQQAILNALTTLGISIVDSSTIVSELVVFPLDQSFILSHRLILEGWEVIVDAATGAIKKYGRIGFEIDGTGNVYPKDPANSSLTNVTIPRLLGAGYTLDGTYVKVLNAEIDEAYSASRNFSYTPPSYTQHDDTHFDEVNVYYHVDRFSHNYWPAAGFSGLGGQIEATVHTPYSGSCGYTGHDNAIFCPDDNALYFGHGVSLFWDLAKKDDVIYHEFTHAVSWAIGLTPGVGSPNETWALHEGYSDYHAASFTNDYEIGEWVTRGYDHLRTLDSEPGDFHYSDYDEVSYTINDPGTPHANSMIWSNALWDLRDELGASTTNFLVYKGLVYQHGTNTTFMNGREGIITADQNYYGSAHLLDGTITNVFGERGIGLGVKITGPVELFWKQSGMWTANRINGNGSNSYEWRYRNAGEAWSGVVSTSQSYNRQMPDNDIELEVKLTNQGQVVYDRHYVYRIFDKIAAPSEDEIASAPKDFVLAQNFPNPFNPETTIRFGLPHDTHVKIFIVDLMGREVRTLIDGAMKTGYHAVIWDGKDGFGHEAPSGIYLYHLRTENFHGWKKLTLVR